MGGLSVGEELTLVMGGLCWGGINLVMGGLTVREEFI